MAGTTLPLDPQLITAGLIYQTLVLGGASAIAPATLTQAATLAFDLTLAVLTANNNIALYDTTPA